MYLPPVNAIHCGLDATCHIEAMHERVQFGCKDGLGYAPALGGGPMDDVRFAGRISSCDHVPNLRAEVLVVCKGGIRENDNLNSFFTELHEVQDSQDQPVIPTLIKGQHQQFLLDLSAATQHIDPTEKEINALNERLEWQLANQKRGLRFVKLDEETVEIVV